MSEVYSPISLQALSFRCIIKHGYTDHLRGSPLKHELQVFMNLEGQYQISNIKIELFKMNGDRAGNSDWPQPTEMEHMEGWNNYVPEIRERLRIRVLRNRHHGVRLFLMAYKNFKPLVLCDWKSYLCDEPPSQRRPQVFARRYYENRTVIEEHFSLWTHDVAPTSEELSKTGQYLSITQSKNLSWIWKVVSKHERLFLDDDENLVWSKSHAILSEPWCYDKAIQRDDFIMTVRCEARRVVGDW